MSGAINEAQYQKEALTPKTDANPANSRASEENRVATGAPPAEPLPAAHPPDYHAFGRFVIGTLIVVGPLVVLRLLGHMLGGSEWLGLCGGILYVLFLVRMFFWMDRLDGRCWHPTSIGCDMCGKRIFFQRSSVEDRHLFGLGPIKKQPPERAVCDSCFGKLCAKVPRDAGLADVLRWRDAHYPFLYAMPFEVEMAEIDQMLEQARPGDADPNAMRAAQKERAARRLCTSYKTRCRQ